MHSDPAQPPKRKKARSPLREPGSFVFLCTFLRRGRGDTGNVLLSHNLASHYHWGCSVSLPCSEWERVGPLRDDHQKRKALLRCSLLARESRSVKALHRRQSVRFTILDLTIHVQNFQRTS